MPMARNTEYMEARHPPTNDRVGNSCITLAISKVVVSLWGLLLLPLPLLLLLFSFSLSVPLPVLARSNAVE